MALAEYLRERAAAFSLSADAIGEQHIATAGMALLDAAELAQGWGRSDLRLEALSRAGGFEAMPDGASRFLEPPGLRAAVQRPLSGRSMTGAEILALIMRTVCGA